MNVMLSVWFNHVINIFFRKILGKPLNSSYDYTHPFFRPIKFKVRTHRPFAIQKKKTTTHTLSGIKYVTFSIEKVYKNEMIKKQPHRPILKPFKLK